MKKIGYNLPLIIIAILCVFHIWGAAAIKAGAASEPSGQLLNGYDFNLALKNLVAKAENISNSYYTSPVKKIEFTSKKPAGLTNSDKVGKDVTAYYDAASKTAYIVSDHKILFNPDSSDMFSAFSELTEIKFGNKVDTSKVTDMNGMFEICYDLTTVDLQAFNTANVTDMHKMFRGCTKLKSIDLRSFNTAKVTDMSEMFRTAPVASITFGKGFNTQSVTDMHEMFCKCSHLTELDLSRFNTAKVTDMSEMFSGCYSLKTLKLSSFNTSNVEDMVLMFYDCHNLEELDLSSFDISKAANRMTHFPKNLNRNNTYDMLSGYIRSIIAPKKMTKPLDVMLPMVLDDNRDDIPDTSEKFSAIPVSGAGHRYIAWIYGDFEQNKGGSSNSAADQKQAVKVEGHEGFMGVFTEGDITYQIYADKTAVVTKIDAKGKVTIDSVAKAGITYPVTEILANAAKGNKKITSLVIGKNVKKVGKKAFYGCKKLKKVTINANKALKLEKGAFSKIHKNAKIVLKGVKGKTKKKLIKAIFF